MKHPLHDPRAVRKLIQEHQFFVKKGYGQNFLTDGAVLDLIVDAAGERLTGDDRPLVALEIGPGLGTLTEALAESGFSHVVSIEKDAQLIPVLAETLAGHSHVTILQADALEIDFAQLPFVDGHALRIVANLPYYVTTPILMRILESELPYDRAVFMVQREVAERMVATPGGKDYGALSVAVQYYCRGALVCVVPPEAFFPPPTVESAVIVLDRKKEHVVSEALRPMFFRVVRAAFAVRRKTLANALATHFGDKAFVRSCLEDAMIDPVRRGETLTLEEFARLAVACSARSVHAGGDKSEIHESFKGRDVD